MQADNNYKNLSGLLLLVLAACRGGGASSTTTSATTAPPPPASPPPAVNQPPSVDAGLDQTVIEGSNVGLSGTASDADGAIAAVEWVQVSGPAVSIVRPDGLSAGFDAPSFYLGGELVFRLTARDDDDAMASDEVIVRIEPDFAQLPITYGTAYFARSLMQAPVEYFQLDTDPTVRYRIVLRSFIENDDVEVYSARDLSPASLVGQSASSGLENDTVYLEPGSPSPVYVRILGQYGDQYTLTLREPSEFLEDGFPVDVIAISGTYQDGAESRAVTVGNIDADPALEILVSAVAQGPLFAFHHDGTLVQGWPLTVDFFTTYPSLGNLSGNAQLEEIALGLGPTIGSCVLDRYLVDGTGNVFPGWPMTACHGGTTIPPALVDIDGDGIDEVFFEDRTGFYADGQAIPGWENENLSSGQPAIADVTGNGRPDFVYSTYTVLNDIEAYDVDGNLLIGFPIVDDPAYDMLRGGPIGLPDFDADGVHEIVRIRKPNSRDEFLLVEVYDGNGNQLWETQTGTKPEYRAVPAFGDLDGDGRPELLIQTHEELYVWHGDGSLVPGFPVIFVDPDLTLWPSASAPLVADVTGDGLPDIIVGDGAFVSVFDATGRLVHAIQVPNELMMAVADVDLDGRNEIVTASTQWNGHNFERHARVWLLDLGGAPHGPVQWGQLGGSARRHFSFPYD
jgi:hypothetical protein